VSVSRLAVAVIVLASMSPAGWALACSCVWAGPFTAVAPGQPLVVLGEVLSYRRNSMAVKVREVVQGAESRDTIRIWGDDGAQCRPYVTGFPRGTTWLFAVRPLPDQPGDYVISVCGAFWLEVRGDQAVGRITARQHDAPLESAPLSEVPARQRHRARGDRSARGLLPDTAVVHEPDLALDHLLAVLSVLHGHPLEIEVLGVDRALVDDLVELGS
jgi:hypothetical protein